MGSVNAGVGGVVPFSSRVRGPNYSGAVHVHVDDILEYIQGDTMPVPCDPHEILANRVEGLRLVPG